MGQPILFYTMQPHLDKLERQDYTFFNKRIKANFKGFGKEEIMDMLQSPAILAIGQKEDRKLILYPSALRLARDVLWRDKPFARLDKLVDVLLLDRKTKFHGFEILPLIGNAYEYDYHQQQLLEMELSLEMGNAVTLFKNYRQLAKMIKMEVPQILNAMLCGGLTIKIL